MTTDTTSRVQLSPTHYLVSSIVWRHPVVSLYGPGDRTLAEVSHSRASGQYQIQVTGSFPPKVITRLVEVMSTVCNALNNGHSGDLSTLDQELLLTNGDTP